MMKNTDKDYNKDTNPTLGLDAGNVTSWYLAYIFNLPNLSYFSPPYMYQVSNR